MSFQIESIKVACVWHYDVENQICPICNKNLMDPSQKNISNSTINTNVTIGECNHGIHYDCMVAWRTSNVSCPICMTIWEDAKSVSSSVYVLNLGEEQCSVVNYVNKLVDDTNILVDNDTSKCAKKKNSYNDDSDDITELQPSF